jgi:hypothetical protein
VYDPETGRFTQEDPIGLAGGLNLYGFANGDPVNFSDPYGLQACDPPGSCVSQFVAGGIAVGTAAGALVAGGCTVGTGGACVLGAPGIVAAGAGLGGAVGGLVGTVAEHGKSIVLEAQSIKGKIKEILTAIAIFVGQGEGTIPAPPPPPVTVEERKRPPKKEGGGDPPAP